MEPRQLQGKRSKNEPAWRNRWVGYDGSGFSGRLGNVLEEEAKTTLAHKITLHKKAHEEAWLPLS